MTEGKTVVFKGKEESNLTRISFLIPRDIHGLAKAKAAELKISVSELIRQALEQTLR